MFSRFKNRFARDAVRGKRRIFCTQRAHSEQRLETATIDSILLEDVLLTASMMFDLATVFVMVRITLIKNVFV